MHVKRRRPLPNFEACSVALFTSLALGGAALEARAQTPTGPSVTSTTSTVPGAPSGTATFQIGPTSPPTGAASTWTAEQRAQAFKSADSNGNGRLSRQEAATLTGLPRSFDQIDSNKDGSISSAEFDEALK